MSSSPSPPQPANPQQTAQAQTQLNKDTAVAQYGLNATNQITPQGTLSYQQIGTWADGTPRFQATQSYSPSQQALYDQSTSNQQALGQLGGSQIGRISSLLSTPFDISKAGPVPTFNGDTSAIEARIGDLASQRLEPQLAMARAARENQLANQGITLGSEAYGNAEKVLGQQENDARNQLLLNARQQAFNELGSTYGYNMQNYQQNLSNLLQGRNQPINEITALASGSQVSNPTYVGTPQTSVAPTDLTGLTMNADRINQQNYATQVGQNNAMMGGLFGLAGTGARMAGNYFFPGVGRFA